MNTCYRLPMNIRHRLARAVNVGWKKRSVSTNGLSRRIAHGLSRRIAHGLSRRIDGYALRAASTGQALSTLHFWFWLALGIALLLGAGGIALAAVVPDVRNTNHNLSATGTGTVKATSETQVCVFCHTPHVANISIVAPLWNRELSGATYTTYTSSSIEANAAELAAGPGGSSKLCLSCHDGTLAIGNVNVLDGAAPATIAMAGTGTGGVMPDGSGASTGFTRNLGVNLGNDHPISFTYDDTLASADGELRPITGNPAVATRVAGANPKPQFPLENGQMQCTTCHDPHIRETDTNKGNLKFLRGSRFQQATPTGGAYNTTNDIVCLSCHDKAGQAWANSAHANPLAADETYLAAAATQREFPANTPVWKAACQNCHDTHTVQGSRRLLREGTDSIASPKSGGNPAIEETCYQCHSVSGTSVVTPLTTVPNIKNEFALAIRMPINNSDQGVSTEAHDIGTGAGAQRGKDFVESQSALGVGNLANRHAECTDCHNPHRLIKNKLFNADASTPDAAGTHQHTDDAATLHTNIASGVLRGAFGVEPTYASNSFHVMPSGYTVKRGDPGLSASTLVTESFVTREYQICLKCHSDYGYADNNVYPTGNRPTLSGGGSTASGSNGLTMYSNQAKEFQAPVAHANEPLNLGTDGGADAAWNTRNHRGWHPVMNNTGRTLAARNITGASPFLPPWNNNVGNQTMYCSDCHGNGVASITSVIPDGGTDGNPWGPHGSANPFLLKGSWVNGTGADANLLCFKCHKKANYSTGTNSGQTSGFYKSGFGFGGSENLHNFHVGQIGKELRCTWCHVAVPHGWKNRSLLVNLNDVGAEAGQGGSKEVAISGSANYYTQEPYYYMAKLKIASFATSGNWSSSNCGSVGKTGANLIANSQGSTANNNNTGGCMGGWMAATCSNPP